MFHKRLFGKSDRHACEEIALSGRLPSEPEFRPLPGTPGKESMIRSDELDIHRPWGDDPDDWPPLFVSRLAGDELIEGETFVREELA